MSNSDLIQDWDMDRAAAAGEDSIAWAERITGNLTDAKAVMIYGIVAFCLAAATMAVYIPLMHKNTMIGLQWGFWMHWAIFWPVGVVWMGVSFFDGELMRKIFDWIV